MPASRHIPLALILTIGFGAACSGTTDEAAPFTVVVTPDYDLWSAEANHSSDPAQVEILPEATIPQKRTVWQWTAADPVSEAPRIADLLNIDGTPEQKPDYIQVATSSGTLYVPNDGSPWYFIGTCPDGQPATNCDPAGNPIGEQAAFAAVDTVLSKLAEGNDVTYQTRPDGPYQIVAATLLIDGAETPLTWEARVAPDGSIPILSGWTGTLKQEGNVPLADSATIAERIARKSADYNPNETQASVEATRTVRTLENVYVPVTDSNNVRWLLPGFRAVTDTSTYTIIAIEDQSYVVTAE